MQRDRGTRSAFQYPSVTEPARVNLADQVYALLKAELHDFRWAPGDRLSEGELGQWLG